MKFHSAVLFVKDIVVSLKFYTENLGLKTEHDFGTNVILEGGLTLWQISDKHIISEKCSVGDSSQRFELYFEDVDPASLYSKLSENNVEFLHAIHEEPWGQRTMRFFDPDRHLIEIGEPLEVFISNMFKSGMTAEQISAKSGMPVKTVMSITGLL